MQTFPLHFYGRIFNRTEKQLNTLLELIEAKGTKNNPTRYALARKIESLLEDIADYHFPIGD